MNASMMALAMTLAGIVLAATMTPAAALGLGEAGELEHARANARAGGPVSERDAELLERWGCLSGTRNAFCRQIEYGWRQPPHRRRILRYERN